MYFFCTGDVTKQADLSKFYRNLLDRNVSSGGAFDTERQTETHEDDTMKSQHSEIEGTSVQKGERRQRTSGHESKRRDYKEGRNHFLSEVLLQQYFVMFSSVGKLGNLFLRNVVSCIKRSWGVALQHQITLNDYTESWMQFDQAVYSLGHNVLLDWVSMPNDTCMNERLAWEIEFRIETLW